MSTIVVLDAPSNLGLRAPKPGVVPGCYKLAGALRDQRLPDRIGARDAGCVVPPRYDMSGWKPGDGAFNAEGLHTYTKRLADRVETHIAADEFVMLLGGDCSILFGPVLALRRAGRFGLAYIDGHGDFRHAGNSPNGVGATAGEGVAIMTGRGQPDIADIEGLSPYVPEADLVVLGPRDYDEHLDELRSAGIRTITSPEIRATGPNTVGEDTRGTFAHLDGYWVHLDVDVLDPTVMPAVDSPDPGGLDHDELTGLLRPLLADPACKGIDIAIFDPDLDPDGSLAARLADTITAGFDERGVRAKQG